MTTRKRSGSGSKRQLKEKVVQIYESIIKGEDVSKNNVLFWNDFFLLKPNVAAFENEIQKMSQEQFNTTKPHLSVLYINCIKILNQQEGIRTIYALQTLCMLVNSIYRKTMEAQNEATEFLTTFTNDREESIQQLLNYSQTFLESDSQDTVKELCLKLLLILISGNENLNQNVIIEHIMVSSFFECLVKLLCDAASRQIHGYNVVLILTLLVNYRKYEGVNPYIIKLSILDDELALNGYGQVITSSLSDFCNQFNTEHIENQNVSWISSITNIVGNMFISEGILRNQQIRTNNALLLAFYEAIHLNRNFITTLSQTQTDASLPPSPSNTLNNTQGTPDLSKVPSTLDINTQPSNLLVTFFQYCSIVMQDTKSESGTNTVKLCFIILGCITEDQYANSLMHDISLAFKVHLHRLPMRHRKLANETTTTSQPLVWTLLDLLVEFILSHMMKKFPMELYVLCIGVLQRILCYQKRCRIRLNYHWKDLWTALMSLLRFILQNESNLAKKMNIFELSTKVINILNFFITYGDTFLPTPGSYDELYYEIIRMNQVFDNVYSMGLRYSTGDGEFKDNALKLNSSLINVRAITKHFSPKIEDWLSSANLSTPSEQQILDIIKKNYDSLTLKLQDSLDQYERYSEKPNHQQFFMNLLKCIVSDTQSSINCNLSNVQNLIKEHGLIS